MTGDPVVESAGGVDNGTVLQKQVDRRQAMSLLLGGLAAGTAAVGACSPLTGATPEERELKILEWEQFSRKHYRRTTADERAETVASQLALDDDGVRHALRRHLGGEGDRTGDSGLHSITPG